jgi:hypothetical protein
MAVESKALTEGDLIRLLEGAARKGSVEAIEVLLIVKSLGAKALLHRQKERT